MKKARSRSSEDYVSSDGGSESDTEQGTSHSRTESSTQIDERGFPLSYNHPGGIRKSSSTVARGPEPIYPEWPRSPRIQYSRRFYHPQPLK